MRFVDQIVQRRQHRGTRYRVSAECRNMSQRGVGRRSDITSCRATNPPSGMPPPKGHQRKAYYVGCDAVFEACEHLARATKAGLYLVEDEHRPHLVATLAQRLQSSPARAASRQPRPARARTARMPCARLSGRAVRTSCSRSPLRPGSSGRNAAFHSSPSGAPIMLIAPCVRAVVGAPHRIISVRRVWRLASFKAPRRPRRPS